MTAVSLGSLGPKSPYLTESCLLVITCNPASYCPVRAEPHLSTDCLLEASITAQSQKFLLQGMVH